MSIASIRAAIADHFIPEAKQAWKMLSVWAFIAIGVVPDAWAAVQAAGLATAESVPEDFRWVLRALAILGIYLRLVKQQAVAQAAPK